MCDSVWNIFSFALASLCVRSQRYLWDTLYAVDNVDSGYTKKNSISAGTRAFINIHLNTGQPLPLPRIRHQRDSTVEYTFLRVCVMYIRLLSLSLFTSSISCERRVERPRSHCTRGVGSRSQSISRHDLRYDAHDGSLCIYKVCLKVVLAVTNSLVHVLCRGLKKNIVLKSPYRRVT